MTGSMFSIAKQHSSNARMFRYHMMTNAYTRTVATARHLAPLESTTNMQPPVLCSLDGLPYQAVYLGWYAASLLCASSWPGKDEHFYGPQSSRCPWGTRCWLCQRAPAVSVPIQKVDASTASLMGLRTDSPGLESRGRLAKDYPLPGTCSQGKRQGCSKGKGKGVVYCEVTSASLPALCVTSIGKTRGNTGAGGAKRIVGVDQSLWMSLMGHMFKSNSGQTWNSLTESRKNPSHPYKRCSCCNHVPANE